MTRPSGPVGARQVAPNSELASEASAEAVLRLWEQRGPEFDAVNVATALHRLAKRLHVCERSALAQGLRMRGLCAEAMGRIRYFNPQAVANTVWAFATLGHRPEALLGPLAEEAGRKLRDFNPQDLANTAWAFAAAARTEE